MKSLRATLFFIGFFSAAGFAQQAVLPVAEAAVQGDTPAQQRIAAAKQQLAADPKKVQAYNELALAYLRRTRETADPQYLKDADAALTQGLKLDSTDFQLQRTQVALMLARHQFVQARDKATALHLRTPDEIRGSCRRVAEGNRCRNPERPDLRSCRPHRAEAHHGADAAKYFQLALQSNPLSEMLPTHAGPPDSRRMSQRNLSWSPSPLQRQPPHLRPLPKLG
jgi:hypothetical protein